MAIAIATVIFLSTLITVLKLGDRSKVWRILAIGLAAALLVFVIIKNEMEKFEKQKQSKSGKFGKLTKLRYGGPPESPVICFRAGEADETAEFQLRLSESREARLGDFWPAFKNMELSFTLQDGYVYVSTPVYNYGGQIVANLVKNEWQLNTGKYFDRNLDETALEVIDNSNLVLLQIEFLPTCVEIRGRFLDKTGSGFYFGVAYNEKLGKTLFAQLMIDKDHPFTVKIPPIFRYPSDRHPGERVK